MNLPIAFNYCYEPDPITDGSGSGSCAGYDPGDDYSPGKGYGNQYDVGYGNGDGAWYGVDDGYGYSYGFGTGNGHGNVDGE